MVMVSALTKKLVRDLSRMRGQAITIAIVVACGIASFVTLRSAYASLLTARDAYYDAQRFGDVFVHLKRAPDPVLARIEEIPGVSMAEARLVETVMVPIEDSQQPASARLVGIQMGAEPRLDAPLLRRGRMPEPGRPDEVAVLEAFANAHGLVPGARVPVVINGTLRELRVVGIVMSPEYVFAIPAGGITEDARRFGVFWMDRAVIGPAFQLDGAFDDVVVRLQPNANERDVMERLDALLAPYGGLGAVARDHQPSNYIVENKLQQLQSYAVIAPLIFLGVAAFLVNVVLSRLVYLQRPQIATLKALGYRNAEIGLHYLELVLVIVVIGALAGIALGIWLGRGMLHLYQQYFEFPEYTFRLGIDVVATSVLVSALAESAGALATVRRVSRLAPAEAMLPEAPPTYRASLFERIGPGRWLSIAARMVLRELVRRPLRLLLSVTGISMGIAVIVSGAFIGGAMDAITGLEFEKAEREDVSVTFTQAIDADALRELSHVRGVLGAEGLRVVPVRVRNGDRFRDIALTGHPDGATLRRVFEWPGNLVPIPEDGVLLTDVLAQRLDVGIGDVVDVEVLEGRRQTRRVRVSGLAHEMFGLNAHMSMRTLHALLDETDVVTTALLTVDPRLEAAIDEDLKAMPRVATVSRRKDIIDLFERQSAQATRTTSLILTIFGAMIAVGVVYNNARVALSMRSRDLASLRVLGFTRREISAVLLGELFTYVVLSILPGLLLGKLLAVWIMGSIGAEMFRMPAVVTPGTYVFSAAVTSLAALASALVVRRQLDKLDLVAVLKARE
jgi:putative ABC transport system permease protein